MWLIVCVTKVRSVEVDGAKGGAMGTGNSGQVSVILGLYIILC